MSRTPPARRRPAAQVSGVTVRVVALIADPGEDITNEDRSEEWEVVSVRQLAGSQGLSAELFRKLDVAGRMKNRTISELEPQKVEVWTLGTKGELDQPLFWGEMDTRSMRLSPNGEGETATATVRDYHFGTPLRGMDVWDADAEETLVVEHDAEFNPLVDGRIIDNMMRQQASESFPDCNIWFLPESTRTETAYENHGDLVSPFPWDVNAIFKTLCVNLNTEEYHVDNYDPADDDFADAPAVKNVTLRRGQYLSQLLDALLPPFGYQWYLAPTKVDGTGRIKPRITIYQRGTGAKKKLMVPKLDDIATLQHNADSLSLAVDVGSTVNQVRCDGGVKEYEVTITPLYRAWTEAQDDTDIADMTKSADGAYANGIIWRKWVGNEAGDYTGTRVTVKPIGDPQSYDAVFGAGNWVIRRRHVGNCLTWEDAEHTRRRPAFVEWWDGSAWVPVNPSWGCRILTDEIGVMFTGDSPPEEIVAQGDNAALRITGTIQGDQRLTYTAERQTDHPNPHTVESVMDVSDQFQYRERHAWSLLTGDADEVDDTAALESFAESVRDQKEPVVLQASVGLFGIQIEYQIGDIITEIDGRQIKLNRLPAARGERYLQVVGREWDFASQRTTLHVMPYDK